MIHDVDDWMIDVIENGGSIDGFVMERDCVKCGVKGWAFFLEAPYSNLITEAAVIFRYPGIKDQFARFLSNHEDVAERFAEIKERSSRAQAGRRALSQGCFHCDMIWGPHYLMQDAQDYFRRYGAKFPKILDSSNPEYKKHPVRFAFTVDTETVFDE